MRPSRSAVIIPKIGNRESLQLAHSYHQNGKDRLKFNVLWSRLIIKQVKQSLPVFLDFSSFTDSNLFFFPHSTILDIFTVFTHLVIIIFSYFTNFLEVWKYSEKLQKFSQTVTSFFNLPVNIDPSNIFFQPSLYLTIIFGFYSIIFYIYVYLLKTKKIITIRKIADVFLTISQGISFLLLIYEFSNIPVNVMQFLTSNNYYRSLYLIEPIICLFSLPSTFILIIRSIVVLDITSFPYLSSEPLKSFIQILNKAIICSIIPLFGNVTNKSIYYKTWLLVIILLISFHNVYTAYHYPSFLRPVTQILFFSSSLVLPVNSIIAYAISLTESPPKYLAIILFTAVNLICPILSFVIYRLRSNYYKDLVFKHQTSISELTEETLFKIFTYANHSTLPILTSIDFVQQVNEKFPFSDRCLILSLRFLFSTKKHSDYIFQRSAFLFRSSMGNAFSILHLAMLIELSNELMLQNVFQTTIRLNKLDRIISECCDAHVFFWQSVLLDDLPIISDCSFLLYNYIIRASNYFLYLNNDVKLSPEYKKRYYNFNQYISVNLIAPDESYGITPSPSLGTWKPTRIKESKSSHITFQENIAQDLLLVDPTKESEEKTKETTNKQKKIEFISQNKSMDNVSKNLLLDNFDNESDLSTSRKSKTDSNTKAYRNVNMQIPPAKYKIAEQISDFTLPGQKVRNYLIYFFFIVNFLVYAEFAISCFVHWGQMSRFWAQSKYYYDLNFVFYNSSYQLIFYLMNDTRIYYDYLFFDDHISHYSTNASDIISLIESSKEIYRKTKIKLSNESLSDLLFDSYLSTMNRSYSNFTECLHSPNFLNSVDLLTETSIDLLYKDFNQTENLLKDENDAYVMLKRCSFFSIALSVLLFPFFTYFCIKTYKEHSKIFWQPLLINKFEVKRVYQYFSNECLKQSSVRNKITFEKKKKGIKQRRFDFQLTVIILSLFAVYLIPLGLTNIHNVLCSFLFKNYANMIKGIHYTTYTCVPYIGSIYQLLVASQYHSSVRYNSYQSLVSNLKIISHFIRQSNNSYSIVGKKGYQKVPIEKEDDAEFCYPPLFAINITNQPSLYEISTIDIGDTMLSLKFFAALRLLGFNLLQNVPLLCIHPENHSSVMELIHEWFSVGPIFHKYCQAVSFHFNKNAIESQITGVISFLFIGIIQIILLVYGFKTIKYLNDFVKFMTRLLAIVPNESPLVNPETNEFQYFKTMPKIDMMSVIDCMPVALVVVDKNNKVVQSNQMAKDIFGGMVNYGGQFRPLSELIDKNGILHFFKVISSLMKNFPYHPYLRDIDGASKFFVFQDISSVKNKISNIRMLTYDLVNFRKAVIQPTITPRPDIPDPVLLLDQIVIVEIVFPENMSQNLFFAFLMKTIEISNKCSTVFLHDTKRSTFLIVFSSFNQHVKLMQHYRDAIKCAQFLYDYYCSICDNQSRIKIAVCQSDRSICKIIDSNIVKVELFSSSLMKSAMLLKYANQGDIIVESEVLRSILDFVSSQMVHGTLVFEGQQINYSVITNGLSFRDTIIDF